VNIREGARHSKKGQERKDLARLQPHGRAVDADNRFSEDREPKTHRETRPERAANGLKTAVAQHSNQEAVMASRIWMSVVVAAAAAITLGPPRAAAQQLIKRCSCHSITKRG